MEPQIWLESAFGACREGFAVLDGGDYAYVNEAWASMLGCPRSALLGSPMATRVPSEDRPFLAAWLDDAQRGPVELRLRHADERVRLLGLTPLHGLGRAGELDGILARDLSEERLVQADLLVADRMMSIGALAAGVAHDINNPLSYVLGNLDFLSGELEALLEGVEPELAKDLSEAVHESKEGADRVRRIISDLRAFARSDAGVSRPLDVVRVVDSAVNMAFVEIRHRARLDKRLEPTPPVEANEARLGQVVLNLLLNSVHAMRAGAQDRNVIRVRTYTNERGAACIEVSDNGPGIPPEIVGRIFDPFFTTKPRGTGTGLGLAMAHGVVSELGGHVAVESKLGEGTTLLVEIPPACGSDEGPRTDPAARHAPVQGPARVFVVDDDPLITSLIRRGLERAGHAVEVAAGGDEAIARLTVDIDFDVVFCDLLMPGCTGMDVYGWVVDNQACLAPKMVFMSGGVFTERVHRFLSSVSNLRVDKPFEVEALPALIEKLRARPSQLSQ